MFLCGATKSSVCLKGMLAKGKAVPNIWYVDHLSGAGDAVLQSACRIHLEGIVFKHLGAAYSFGGPSLWCTARSGEWQPLRPSLVVEVRYDHITGNRSRHGTGFLRGRPVLALDARSPNFLRAAARSRSDRQTKQKMSKAFTKENDFDQDAILPERPVPPHPNLVTSEGLAQIEVAVQQLAEQQRCARDAGDTAAATSAARDLRYWTSRQATAELIQSRRSSQVQFGSTVTIRRSDASKRTYRVVGIDEADPARGTLSYVAPLAQALLGKEFGDTVVVGAHEETVIEII